MWSCALVQTPPSWPVIQPSGRSFGQVASTANFGAFWALQGGRGRSAADERNAGNQVNR